MEVEERAPERGGGMVLEADGQRGPAWCWRRMAAARSICGY